MWVRGYSRSVKMVPFETLGTVSCLLSILTIAVSLAISEIFSVKQWPDLEIWVWVVQGHWKWRGSIDRVWLSIGPPLYIALSCTIFDLFDIDVIWRWIISWPWNLAKKSLKIIETGAIRKLGVVSYSRSIVTMAVSVAVCEIFSVKEWCDHENRVRVRWRSFEMIPFDRLHRVPISAPL